MERPRAQPRAADLLHHELAKEPAIEPLRVEEIAIQYQQEWQLWSFVVRNFSDPHAHLAYLSFITRNLAFATGSKRYREYRAHYLPIAGEGWRVSKADAAIDQIQALCDVQFERSLKLADLTFGPASAEAKPLARSWQVNLLYFLVGLVLTSALWILVSVH